MNTGKTLEGKVALVTGGSRGIGAATALRLAREGARVAITWVSNEEAANDVVRRGEGRIIAIQSDAADAGATKALVPEVIARLGRLDILVNNAGIIAVAPLPDATEEDFDRSFDINVRAPFLLSREASKVMESGGRIITIGSVNGFWVPGPGMGAYAASKAAVAAFTRAWARDLGPRGITVNNVQPGPVDTDLNPATGPFAPMLVPRSALGRYGTADEVASLVAFLAQPESQYITGASLTIDGGLTS
ncbi:Oxidoreductase, short chain dehydrogenase/reductase family protein [Minicystis rosea]|nr:Oxidoreductase, short chain dehydrogenase/reductase family protein [Minicystis rosea]